MAWNIKAATLLSIFMTGFLSLHGCANSEVSRTAASNVDTLTQKGSTLGDETDWNMNDAYENTSQATKGAVIGGAAGAIVGAIYSGIGVLPGAAGGILLGAGYGHYIDANTTLRDRLENRGANIIILGDQVLIVVPSARLFRDGTADVKSQAYSTVKMLAQYVNQFTKTLVKVSAFTNDTGSSRVDLALSKQQADHVARLLKSYGVDARLLYAEGYGSTNLVSSSAQDWRISQNYRIEITLEKLVV